MGKPSGDRPQQTTTKEAHQQEARHAEADDDRERRRDQGEDHGIDQCLAEIGAQHHLPVVSAGAKIPQ